MAWIMIHATLRPELVPAGERKIRVASAAEYLSSLRELGCVFLILATRILRSPAGTSSGRSVA